MMLKSSILYDCNFFLPNNNDLQLKDIFMPILNADICTLFIINDLIGYVKKIKIEQKEKKLIFDNIKKQIVT